MLSLVNVNGSPSRMLSPCDLERARAGRPSKRRVARLERALVERVGGVDGEVAEVHRVPQDDAVGDARVDVPLVVVGQAQADHLHVARGRTA